MAKRLAPYLIAAAAVALLAWRVNFHKLSDSFQRAPMVLFVGMSALLLMANLAADTFAMTTVFGWFGCRVRYRDLLIVRGATYLVAIVNYHVGQAAVLGYLYRTLKVPIKKAGGWILFIIGVNVGTLLILASGGALAGASQVSWLWMVPTVFGIAAALYGLLLLAKPRFLVKNDALAPLFQMGILGHLKGVLVRLPHVGVLTVWHYCSLRLFGVHVPPIAAVFYLALYMAAAAVPINFNGWGPAQWVAVSFFTPYAGEGGQEAVFAYTIATSSVSMLLQAALGLFCLRRGAALGLIGGAPAVEPAIEPGATG
jgi:hypothetical protein